MSDDMFPKASLADVRRKDMIDELDREIKVRQRVYPRWVAAGKLDRVTADRRIIILRAILRKLRKEGVVE